MPKTFFIYHIVDSVFIYPTRHEQICLPRTAVAAVQAEDLEGAFRRSNTVDDYWAAAPEVYPLVGKMLRSTSVGDIIQDENDFYLVDVVGFSKLTKFEIPFMFQRLQQDSLLSILLDAQVAGVPIAAMQMWTVKNEVWGDIPHINLVVYDDSAHRWMVGSMEGQDTNVTYQEVLDFIDCCDKDPNGAWTIRYAPSVA